jgi:hypothetical protein
MINESDERKITIEMKNDDDERAKGGTLCRIDR